MNNGKKRTEKHDNYSPNIGSLETKQKKKNQINKKPKSYKKKINESRFCIKTRVIIHQKNIMWNKKKQKKKTMRIEII